jgi:hypothetical protein
MALAADYPLLNIFLSMLYFFVFVLWIFLVFSVLVDVFRSPDLGGLSKALWVIFIIALPFLGVFAYLLVRGGSMHERSAQAADAQDAAVKAYIQQAAGSTSTADELTKLAQLRDSGVITAADFEAQKARLLG